MDQETELYALRSAVLQMGLDPQKVAAFFAEERDHVCRSILFQCVGLDEQKLLVRAGERTNLEGWRAVWSQLACHP